MSKKTSDLTDVMKCLELREKLKMASQGSEPFIFLNTALHMCCNLTFIYPSLCLDLEDLQNMLKVCYEAHVQAIENKLKEDKKSVKEE